MKLDVIITGVGGQGVVLASRVLAQAAMDAGFQVRTSETIGMAQREGSVTSQVRIGDELHGAIIPNNQANILISFELAETVRGLSRLKPGGKVIANTAKIIPVSVNLGLSQYQEQDIRDYLQAKVPGITFLNALELAQQAGHFKTTNMVLLGALSVLPEVPFSKEILLDTALAMVPEKLREVNRQAFELGRREMGAI